MIVILFLWMLFKKYVAFIRLELVRLFFATGKIIRTLAARRYTCRFIHKNACISVRALLKIQMGTKKLNSENVSTGLL